MIQLSEVVIELSCKELGDGNMLSLEDGERVGEWRKGGRTMGGTGKGKEGGKARWKGRR
jgi:hypothetical protein